MEGWKKASVDEPPVPPNSRDGAGGLVEKLHDAIAAAPSDKSHGDLVENETKISPPRTPSPTKEEEEDMKIKKD